jgi:CheY-like chemotaxis protein
MNGTALARAAHELRPDLPVLLCSGYGGEQFEARAAEAGVRAVLAKPLTARALALALQREFQDTLQR